MTQEAGKGSEHEASFFDADYFCPWCGRLMLGTWANRRVCGLCGTELRIDYAAEDFAFATTVLRRTPRGSAVPNHARDPRRAFPSELGPAVNE